MNKGSARIVAGILLLVAAVFVVDRLLPAGVSASVLYVVPILLAMKLSSSRWLASVTALTIAATAVDFILTREAHLWSDELLSILALVTTAYLVGMQLRASRRERDMYLRAEAERRRLALVHEIASATSGTLELDAVLKSVTENLAALFRSDTVAIWLADESGSELRPAYARRPSYSAVEQRHQSVPLESSPMTIAEAVRRRKVLIARADQQTPAESREILKMVGAEMEVAVPLYVGDRLVGAMTLAFETPRPFDAGDFETVETIGSQVAIAIENARLFGDANKQREQLALINEIGHVFTSTLDLQAIYSAMREQLKGIIDCETLLVSLYDDETETIRCGFAYTDGEVLSPDQFDPIKLGKGPHSKCIRSAKPLIVDNIARSHPGSFRYVGNTDNHPVSVLYVPMIAEGRVIGVIQAQSLREGAYTQADVPLLSIIANQAAIAIQNAALYRDAVEGRRAVEQANRIKDEFLAMLSHELRTPLTPILGWTRILSGLPPDDVETRDHALRVIERNTRLQSQLVNDLLDLSRIESGKISISPAPTDLNASVRAAVESIRGEADQRGIEIVEEFIQPAPYVMVDPARLGQIINNLLANAIKFTDERGHVTVRTRQSDGAGIISVTDTGIGIAQEFLPHVFDKFRQADSSMRRRHSGLGLGLSIVKSLAEMQGGVASAHSDGPGLGATFTVRLPAATGAQESVEPPLKTFAGTSQEDSTPSEVRLLVIEDDPDTLDMMRVLFDAQRMKVTGVRTVEEAFALLNVDEPDLIISDISLPGLDGHELARQLRRNTRLHHIPLIALTGHVTDQDRARALNAGFDAHLSKPINYSELFDLVRSLTGPQVVSR